MKKAILFLYPGCMLLVGASLALSGCSGAAGPVLSSSVVVPGGLEVPDESDIPKSAAMATFAGGCFWCVEETFMQLPGVYAVVSGYSGGTAKDAKYGPVSAGRTDHAEAVQVHYDPDQVSFGELVAHFWKVHDPTQVNRQGNDIGRQYRSVIFFQDEEQRKIAAKAVADLDESGRFARKVATQIVALDTFYPAEEYHQNYYRKNPNDAYCRAVLVPKLKKLGMKYFS